MCDANTEANAVPEPTPLACECSDGVAHFEGHQHRLERGVLHWHWIIEDHHHPVTGIPFECAVVLDDDFANGRVVVAQQSHHVFGIRAFGEPSGHGNKAGTAATRAYV
jgi:hypothetical protein